MTRALSLSTRSGVYCRSRTRPFDKQHTPETLKRRGVWTQARRRGKASSGGESSEEAPPPEEKTPEPIIAEEVLPPPPEDDPEEDIVSPWKENREGNIKELKTTLLTTVAGFDRGFAAIPRDVARVRSIAESLETLSGSIDLTSESTTTRPDAKECFDGTWKLIFTSAFDTGKMTRRPGANFPLSPFTFGPVYQVVDTAEGVLDNVVELLLTGVPRLPWSPSNAVPRVRLTLRHDMKYSMSIVNITLKTTSLKLLDSGFDLPPLTTRPLPTSIRSLFRTRNAGEFTLVFMDEDLRITESKGSDLRIFVKTNALED